MERTGKRIFDRLRNIQLASQQKPVDPFDIKETLTSKHFAFAEVSRHGFPHDATCIAFDPIQKLLAIGTANGQIRIIGRPGVDLILKQDENDASILRIQFLVNEGAFVTLCADNCIHLWNFRQKRPEIVHSLKFQREKLTTIHLPFQSKWLYLGTDRGNVHIVALETFSLSGYIINWNKAIDLSQTTHPGHVLHLSDCPTDESKLLIGFERGTVVLWDLKIRQADLRFQCEQGIKCIAWHFEGKQFICGHTNGSLSTWSLRRPQEPLQYLFPHAKNEVAVLTHQTSTLTPGASSSQSHRSPCNPGHEKFRPITCLEWKQHKNGEESIMFSGGTPLARSSSSSAHQSSNLEETSRKSSADASSSSSSLLRSRHSVTIIKGKSVTVLEMQHKIDAFVALCESPYVFDAQEPYALAVLMRGDLAIIDLTSHGYPCFENPNPMDIHESPVTCITYLADCQPDLIPALYSVGAKQQRKRGFSEKPWPIKGGECGECPFSYSEIIITGHADGSVKFWDSSSINLQVLYKLKTSKLFERRSSSIIPPSATTTVESSSGAQSASTAADLLAVDHLDFCQESRQLAVAGRSGHVILFKFEKQDVAREISVLEVGVVCKKDDSSSTAYDALNYNFGNAAVASSTMSNESENTTSTMTTMTNETPTLKRAQLKTQHSVSSLASDGTDDSQETKFYLPIKAKGGVVKQTAGFQAEVICLTMWQASSAPENVVALAFNTAYNLLAYSTENATIIIDILQQICVMNLATCDLYGKSAASFAYPNAGYSILGESKKLDEQQHSNLNSPAASEPKSEVNSAHSSLEMGVNPNAPQLTRQSAVVGVNSGPSTTTTAHVSFATSPPTSSKAAVVASLTSPHSPSTSSGGGVAQRSSPLAPKAPSKATSVQGSSPSILRRPFFKSQTVASDDYNFQSYKEGGACNQSRSRSSSCASLSNLPGEHVTCLAFLDSLMSKKNECFSGPTLWCGTNCGTILALSLRLNFESRLEQPVYALPSGISCSSSDSGALLKLAFIDQTGDLLIGPADCFRDPAKSRLKNRCFLKSRGATIATATPASPTISSATLAVNAGSNDIAAPPSAAASSSHSPHGSETSLIGPMNQYLIAVYEKAIKIYSLTSSSFSKPVCQISCPGPGSNSNNNGNNNGNESSATSASSCVFVATSIVNVVQPSEQSSSSSSSPPPVVVCFVKPTGRVTIHSLPSLKLLADFDNFSTLTTNQNEFLRICHTIQFSQRGHGICMRSPTEIEKFVLLAEMADQLKSGVCCPDLFQATQTPEPPKQNFFKELFIGSSSKSLDREELFGESSGKVSKGIAKHIPGSANLDQLRAQSGGAAGEIARARLALNERGEKLGDVEERTAQMLENTKSYADHAQELLNKYKKKKWYKL